MFWFFKRLRQIKAWIFPEVPADGPEEPVQKHQADYVITCTGRRASVIDASSESGLRMRKPYIYVGKR
ncbi:hypothetical protein N7528_007999 [Penicillium herquei]|nr:hypothetical protein N7528_007999 [Penicillium herquei]